MMDGTVLKAAVTTSGGRWPVSVAAAPLPLAALLPGSTASSCARGSTSTGPCSTVSWVTSLAGHAPEAFDETHASLSVRPRLARRGRPCRSGRCPAAVPAAANRPGQAARSAGTRPARTAVAVVVAVLPVLAFAGLIALVAPDREVGKWWKLGGTGVLLAGYVLLGWLCRPRRRAPPAGVLAGARAVVRGGSARRAPGGTAEWGLKGRAVRWDSTITGSFLGTGVLVCQVQLPGGKDLPRLTVVAFTDPIPGLPDFDLEPADSPRPIGFSELLAQIRRM